ncbi:MAG: hypothetical protein JKX99_05195 [Robiginitomaculum sp.]|nr:hypothetical protein [Robiginitomaculum sp.]
MTNNIENLAVVGTMAVFSLIAANPVSWPEPEGTVYEVPENSPSYSSVTEQARLSTTSLVQNDFVREMSAVYAALSDGQEPLGAEFEAVWDQNIDTLYES